MRDPPPGAWHRVWHYVAWMRRVSVGESLSVFGDDTLRQLCLNSPVTGKWFLALRNLTWCITKYSFPYADLFFSPHLEIVFILVSSVWRFSDIPRAILPAVTSTISAIPGSALQCLHISMSYRRVPWEHFKESLSSVVLRCGPSRWCSNNFHGFSVLYATYTTGTRRREVKRPRDPKGGASRTTDEQPPIRLSSHTTSFIPLIFLVPPCAVSMSEVYFPCIPET